MDEGAFGNQGIVTRPSKRRLPPSVFAHSLLRRVHVENDHGLHHPLAANTVITKCPEQPVPILMSRETGGERHLFKKRFANYQHRSLNDTLTPDRSLTTNEIFA